MKAAFVTGHCRASEIQVGELPDPDTCGPNDVLVEIAVATVNPIDTYIRSGAVGAELSGPWIPGCDFAGRVVSTGSDVSLFSVGDRVWGSNQSMGGRQGTLAERIVVDEQWVYSTPEGVSDEAAVAGSLTGITAHLGLHLHAGLQSGETVFVNGGTGGVGSAVVQLAKQSGAVVICTVGDDRKAAQAKDLGADHVVVYRADDASAQLKALAEHAGGIDVWYETLRSPEPETTIPLMAKRGRMIVMAGRDARPVLPVGPLYVNDLRLIGFAMFNASPDEQRQSADDINAAAAAGQYCPLVGQRFALDQAADAHQLQEDNTIHGAGTLTGKILVEIS